MHTWTSTRRASGDQGAVFLEYGLLASLVAVVVAVALGPLGIAVGGLLDLATDLF